MILGLWFISLCSAASSLADGGLAAPFYKEISPTWDFLILAYFGAFAHIFFITAAVEYLIVYLLLGRPTRGRIQLIFYIMLANVITKPAGHSAMLFIADPDLLGSRTLERLAVFIIELVILVVEFGIMRLTFHWMYCRGLIHEPVTARRTILIAALANVASFAFGLVGPLLLRALIMR